MSTSTQSRHRVRALAREHRADELLAAAAARSAAELLARGETISADRLHEACDRYRALLLDAFARALPDAGGR